MNTEPAANLPPEETPLPPPKPKIDMGSAQRASAMSAQKKGSSGAGGLNAANVIFSGRR